MILWCRLNPTRVSGCRDPAELTRFSPAASKPSAFMVAEPLSNSSPQPIILLPGSLVQLKAKDRKETKPIQQRQINEHHPRRRLALKLKLLVNFLLVVAGKQIISSSPALGAWLLFNICLGLQRWEFYCLQHLQRQSY